MNEIKNIASRGGKENGFLKIIILIIIALLIMKYFGITISGVINWFSSIISVVFLNKKLR